MSDLKIVNAKFEFFSSLLSTTGDSIPYPWYYYYCNKIARALNHRLIRLAIKISTMAYKLLQSSVLIATVYGRVPDNTPLGPTNRDPEQSGRPKPGKC